jgi:pSer/pThr/pTyr-binding forkhead associated (FHA) protein
MPKLPPIPGYCSSCGHYNEIIARFCAQCGAALTPAKQPQSADGPVDVELLNESENESPSAKSADAAPVSTDTLPERMSDTRTTTKTVVPGPASPRQREGGTTLWKALADVPTIETDEFESHTDDSGEEATVVEPCPTTVKLATSGTGKDVHSATTIRLDKEHGAWISAFDDDTVVVDSGSKAALTRIVPPGEAKLVQASGLREPPLEPGKAPAEKGRLLIPPDIKLESSEAASSPTPTEASTAAEIRKQVRSWLVVLRAGGVMDTFGLDDQLHLVGKSASCDLRLDDELASRNHLIVQILRDQHYLIDVKSRRGTLLNGESVIQAPLRHGDVIQVGKTVILYLSKGVPSIFHLPLHPLNPSKDVPVAATVTSEPPAGEGAQLALTGQDGLKLTSSGKNALIGTHSACAWRLSGEGVAMFHGQVTWVSGEPQLRDLGSEMGSFVNREATQQAILADGDVVQIGHHTFTVQLSGSKGSAAAERQTPASEKAIYMTCIRGPDRGGTQGIATDGPPLLLGHGADVDLQVHDSAVADRHAAVSAEAGRFLVRDITGRKSTVINGAPAREGKVVPGQLFKVGHDVFLVHYGLSEVIYR